MNALTAPGFIATSPVKAHVWSLVEIYRGANQGTLCLVNGKLRATGEVVAVLCAVNLDATGMDLVPLAVMPNGRHLDVIESIDTTGVISGAEAVEEAMRRFAAAKEGGA